MAGDSTQTARTSATRDEDHLERDPIGGNGRSHARVGAQWHGYTLQIGDPRAVVVRVSVDPFQSVMAGLWRVARHGNGIPNGLGAMAPIRPRARFALDALGGDGPGLMPDACLQIQGPPDPSVVAKIRQLRELPESTLLDELSEVFPAQPPPNWQPVIDRPRPWLDALADAAVDMWAALQPHWSMAAPLLDREVSRIGIATVRGALPALLNTLHPSLRYSNGTLRFCWPHDQSFELAGRALVLVPMLTERKSIVISFDQPDAVHIAYPVRSFARTRNRLADLSQLSLVIGPVRAAGLHLLRSPMTVGELALALNCAPNTVSYHCNQLEAAGLVRRERDGRLVRLNRTAQGDELVAVFAGT